MSIIVVAGLPHRWDMKVVVRKLLRTINGKFEALTIQCTKVTRKCYLRLSERLDPKLIVAKINRTTFGAVKLRATIPDQLPYLPQTVKPRGIPVKIRRMLHIPNESTLGEVLYTAHTELMEELQMKFTGLNKLSETNNHVLLRSIAKTIVNRLKEILLISPEEDTSFKLTKAYRKKYPHFGDFKFILSTLHSLEDAEGKPRTQLNNQEFSAHNIKPYFISNIPYERVLEICNKYGRSIVNKITEHTKNLNTDMIEHPTNAQVATLRVREELKKISPYLEMIIRQVIKNNFAPQKATFYKIRIYGEPFMPAKDIMKQFTKRYHAIKIFRSERAFNLLCCKIPLSAFSSLPDADRSVLGGATLNVRLSNLDMYKVPDSMKKEMLSFTLKRQNPEPAPADVQDEWSENW